MTRLAIPAALLLLLGACAGKAPTTAGGGEFGFEALSDALRAHGAQVRPGAKIEQPFFAVPGRFLGVNGEDVQVFEYPDVASARAAAAQISPDGGTIGTAKPFWAAPPHFYLRDRVLVLYTGDAARVRDALEAVLGPQFAGQ